MIKNVVFDIGNVLADYNLVGFLAGKGFDELTIKRIIKASIMSPYWEAFERGELTEDEALERFSSSDPEITKEIEKAYSQIEGMITGREFAVPLVKALKAAGFGVYYLSNYSKKAHDECTSTVEFIEFADGGFLSYQVGMTKPDPRMYKLFLEKYELNANECVFVDDTEKNVIEAKNQGFEGIVFTSYEDMLDKLGALGVRF